jgi:hypothetical protein
MIKNKVIHALMLFAIASIPSTLNAQHDVLRVKNEKHENVYL